MFRPYRDSQTVTVIVECVVGSSGSRSTQDRRTNNVTKRVSTVNDGQFSNGP